MHQHPPDIWTPAKGYSNTMIPADAGIDLKELIRIALYNIDHYDKIPERPQEIDGKSIDYDTPPKTYRQQFEDGLAKMAIRQGWTAAQCKTVADLKKKCPPNKLYRIRGGFHSATRGLSPIGIVVSYRPGQGGGPAEIGAAVLGFSNDMVGSAAQPFPVPAEALEDVTEEARSGKLPELKHGGVTGGL
jgi:hypothetical protein